MSVAPVVVGFAVTVSPVDGTVVPEVGLVGPFSGELVVGLGLEVLGSAPGALVSDDAGCEVEGEGSGCAEALVEGEGEVEGDVGAESLTVGEELFLPA